VAITDFPDDPLSRQLDQRAQAAAIAVFQRDVAAVLAGDGSRNAIPIP
jgi:hypothetical protein